MVLGSLEWIEVKYRIFYIIISEKLVVTNAALIHKLKRANKTPGRKSTGNKRNTIRDRKQELKRNKLKVQVNRGNTDQIMTYLFVKKDFLNRSVISNIILFPFPVVKMVMLVILSLRNHVNHAFVQN